MWRKRVLISVSEKAYKLWEVFHGQGSRSESTEGCFNVFSFPGIVPLKWLGLNTYIPNIWAMVNTHG